MVRKQEYVVPKWEAAQQKKKMGQGETIEEIKKGEKIRKYLELLRRGTFGHDS
jgi:hypothetical protein